MTTVNLRHKRMLRATYRCFDFAPPTGMCLGKVPANKVCSNFSSAHWTGFVDWLGLLRIRFDFVRNDGRLRGLTIAPQPWGHGIKRPGTCRRPCLGPRVTGTFSDSGRPTCEIRAEARPSEIVPLPPQKRQFSLLPPQTHERLRTRSGSIRG
jgi:hypothetical protein